jgi:copper chaperone CopZ
MNTERNDRSGEDLNLAIPDMNTEEAVRRGSAALMTLPGVIAARVIERGAFVRYRPEAVTKDEICQAMARAGFRATVFQDEKSGKTGLSSQ